MWHVSLVLGWKYLDGKVVATPGVYYYQLVVDGERFTRKMIVQKTPGTR